MKKTLCISLLFMTQLIFAQKVESPSNTNFKLGEGLTFDLNDGAYQFYIGGFIQPTIINEKIDDNNAENRFNSQRSFFMIGGNAVKEKLSFLVQSDFSLADPLLDAWIGYHPFNWLDVYVGQKQNFVNNREMIYREDRLQFTDRSLFSQTFSRTGREFGLFIETKFGEKIGIKPQFSITSGDGRGSFGADSRDVDYGGAKIGGRLDFYPLGFFKEGNDLYTSDLLREEKLKVVVGGAVSQNNGASDPVGEGHGTFLMYNSNGEIALPDYTQFYADLLMKYQGFSMLLEYGRATASGLEILYTNPDATQVLMPTQISEFLILGESKVGQFGYVTKSGFSFDVRYEAASPEFTNENSVLNEFTNYTYGLTKYFDGHNLKLQASLSTTEFDQGAKITTAQLLLQFAF